MHTKEVFGMKLCKTKGSIPKFLEDRETILPSNAYDCESGIKLPVIDFLGWSGQQTRDFLIYVGIG